MEYKIKSNTLPFQELVDSFQSSFFNALVEIAATKETRIKHALSGEVYNVRTGRARRGVYATVSQQGNVFTLRIGNNVEYAYTLEFGKKGAESVKAHKRKIYEAFGHQLKNPVTANVKAHTRNVNQPGRSFLMKNTEDVPQRILSATHQLVKGKQ